MSYLFPLAALINAVSMTVLLIGLSLTGQPALAADVGIVQGVTIALFYAFSANARSLVLNPAARVSVGNLLVGRLILLVPLSVVAWYLSVHLAHVTWSLAVALILRRGVEWLGELHLSEMELRGHRKLAGQYLALQVLLLLLVLGWTFSGTPLSVLGLVLWALLPLLMSLGFIRHHLTAGSRLEAAWLQMLPHLGSSAVIGIAVYVFRLLILLIVGKTVAGDLYSAFAIGGALGTIFTMGLGPSLLLHEQKTGRAHIPVWLRAVLVLVTLAGLAVIAMVYLMPDAHGLAGKEMHFWQALGFSLIGGVVMVFAQRQRLRDIQHGTEEDVFAPDVLVNILIVAVIPFMPFVLGRNSLSCLYLFNAVVALVFYRMADVRRAAMGMVAHLHGSKLRAVLAVLLVIPIFVNLETGLFRSALLVYDSGGVLSKLPIPLSAFGCYAGIALLGNYRQANLGLAMIFGSFVLMVLSTVAMSYSNLYEEQAKFILLMQYILPMFALVLGQTYEGSSSNALIFEKVVLYILSILVPIQLVISWLQGHSMLSSYLYLFSIYQHLQYVAVIFIWGYLLSLYSLWPVPRFKMLLILLTPLIGIYAVASVSLLALSAMFIGVIGFAIYRWRLGPDKLAMLVVFLVFLSSACYLPVAMSSSFRDAYIFPQKFAFLGAKLTPKELQLREKFAEGAELTPAEVQLSEEIAQTPVAKRLHYWEYYTKSIVSGPKVFIFGHAERLDRSKFQSAHNYYLDFVYNFGSLSVLPLVGVLGYTLVMVFRCREAILASPSFLGLTVVVLFLLLADNSLKVGLRQPYPGIFTFFLWGLLLARIESLRMADRRRLPAARTQ